MRVSCRLLVVTLQMRNGAPLQGPSQAALAAQNYALEQMGKRTQAYEVVVSNDVEMFRPGKIGRDLIGDEPISTVVC